MKKGRHRRFEEARELKQSNEVDVDAIFRIDELLETSNGEDDEGVPPEHASWYDEFGGDGAGSDGTDAAGSGDHDAADPEPADAADD